LNRSAQIVASLPLPLDFAVVVDDASVVLDESPQAAPTRMKLAIKSAANAALFFLDRII
jgi:hypothetical protein